MCNVKNHSGFGVWQKSLPECFDRQGEMYRGVAVYRIIPFHPSIQFFLTFTYIKINV